MAIEKIMTFIENRRADAESSQELAGLRRVLLGLGPQAVTERLDAPDEGPKRERWPHGEHESAERGVHENVVRADLASKELLDEPDAGAAMQPLYVDLDARRPGLGSCSLAQKLDPFVVSAPSCRDDGPSLRTAEIVVTIEARATEERMNRGAPDAAEGALLALVDLLPAMDAPPDACAGVCRSRLQDGGLREGHARSGLREQRPCPRSRHQLPRDWRGAGEGRARSCKVCRFRSDCGPVTSMRLPLGSRRPATAARRAAGAPNPGGERCRSRAGGEAGVPS